MLHFCLLTGDRELSMRKKRWGHHSPLKLSKLVGGNVATFDAVCVMDERAGSKALVGEILLLKARIEELEAKVAEPLDKNGLFEKKREQCLQLNIDSAE